MILEIDFERVFMKGAKNYNDVIGAVLFLPCPIALKQNTYIDVVSMYISR
jgi:hypothetical protein